MIITNYNRPKELTRCVNSVCRLIEKWRIAGEFDGPVEEPEVIVVDDGSEPSQIEELDFVDKKITLRCIFLNENYGVLFARNVGVLQSSFDTIFFLDSDNEIVDQPFSLFLEVAKLANQFGLAWAPMLDEYDQIVGCEFFVKNNFGTFVDDLNRNLPECSGMYRKSLFLKWFLDVSYERRFEGPFHLSLCHEVFDVPLTSAPLRKYYEENVAERLSVTQKTTAECKEFLFGKVKILSKFWKFMSPYTFLRYSLGVTYYGFQYLVAKALLPCK